LKYEEVKPNILDIQSIFGKTLQSTVWDSLCNHATY